MAGWSQDWRSIDPDSRAQHSCVGEGCMRCLAGPGLSIPPWMSVEGLQAIKGDSGRRRGSWILLSHSRPRTQTRLLSSLDPHAPPAGSRAAPHTSHFHVSAQPLARSLVANPTAGKARGQRRAGCKCSRKGGEGYPSALDRASPCQPTGGSCPHKRPPETEQWRVETFSQPGTVCLGDAERFNACLLSHAVGASKNCRAKPG